MIDSTVIVRTIIPESGEIHVTINDVQLTGEDAIKLGEYIVDAGRRASLLSKLLVFLATSSVENPRETCREFLKWMK